MSLNAVIARLSPVLFNQFFHKAPWGSQVFPSACISFAAL